MSASTLTTERGTALPPSPYVGLVPFSEDDAAFFFGRDEWREVITDNLRAYRLTVLYGESGVGKTSLLRAGVVHTLQEEARRNREQNGAPGACVVYFASWQGDPLAGLARAVAEAVAQACGEDAPAEPAEARDLAAVLEAGARRVGGRLFVILDQLEEYFRYHEDEEGEGTLLLELPRVVNRRDLRASFLLSIREDALARLDRFKVRLPNLFDNSLRLEHLDRDSAREAIVEPLAEYSSRAGAGGEVTAEAELVDEVLDQVEAGKLALAPEEDLSETLGRAGAAGIEAPYLQLVLLRLWAEETKSGSRTLRASTLRDLGGAEQIVRTHLDTVMAGFSPAEQEAVARLFRHLVTRSGTKVALGAGDLADLTGLPQDEVAPLLARLADSDVRILRPTGEGGYEIYHDVLAVAVNEWRVRVEERMRRSGSAGGSCGTWRPPWPPLRSRSGSPRSRSSAAKPGRMPRNSKTGPRDRRR